MLALVSRRLGLAASLAFAVGSLAVVPPAGAARPPALVHDFSTTVNNLNGLPQYGSPLASADGVLYFAGEDATHGNEPWRSDGTPEGTWMLADLCPGPCSSASTPVGDLGDLIVFTADDGIFGQELWASDGTPGNMRLVADLCAGPCRSFQPGIVFGTQFVFYTAGNGEPTRLWITDGTTAGTRLVRETCALGCYPGKLFAFGDMVLFAGPDNHLWRTDGTPEGTRLVAEMPDSPTHGTAPPSDFARAGEVAMFFSLDTWWRTDGTPEGTQPLRQFTFPCCLSSEPISWGAYAFMARYDTGLYRGGGTVAETFPLKDFADDQEQPWQAFRPSNLTPLDHALLFVAGDEAQGLAIWRTDGTVFGTQRVATVAPHGDFTHIGGMVSLGDRALFVVYPWDGNVVPRSQLWTSDGTAAGTHHVLDLCGGSGAACLWQGTPEAFTVAVGDRMLFGLNVEGSGRELWATDGTVAGTRRLADIHRDPGSGGPTAMRGAGAELLLTARTGETTGGVYRLGDDGVITPLAPTLGEDFVRLGDRIVFAGARRELWYSNWYYVVTRQGLWSTDGTADGTAAIHPQLVPWSLAGVGGSLFFGAEQPTAIYEELTGVEPWRSDGTAAGTVSLGDLDHGYDCGPFPGDCSPAGSDPAAGVAVNGRYLFAADDDEHGRELWTVPLAGGEPQRIEINATIEPSPYPGYEVPGWADLGPLTAWRGAAYFAADDGIAGRELWRSDGTLAGTVRVADLAPGSDGSSPHHFAATSDALYFFARDAGAAAGFDALWRTDGTAEGTVRVASLAIDGVPSWGRELVAFWDRLVMVVANASTGAEPWVSDGTAAGTQLLVDLFPGARSGVPRSLRVVDGAVVFAGDDGVAGLEPWRTDGTADGTRRLADLYPGRRASGPEHFTLVGDDLYVAADDGVHGRELWRLDGKEASACATGGRTLCLLGRYAATVSWHDQRTGRRGVGKAVQHGAGTGFFSFFDKQNLELVVKALDATSVNDRTWVFWGGLSDVEYVLTVRDTATGALRRHRNPPGRICGGSDLRAFPAPASVTSSTDTPLAGELVARGDCVGDPSSLCLGPEGRFRVRVRWRNQRGGGEGVGTAVPRTDATGAFWFFGQDNLELVVKVLDGTAVNGRHWVLWGGLTDVEHWLEVEDTQSGATREYHHAPGKICGGSDVNAF